VFHKFLTKVAEYVDIDKLPVTVIINTKLVPCEEQTEDLCLVYI
jgi:hypothetical protein